MSYTTYPSLRDRVVFISGGSSGIGAELVRAFAAQGSKVAFCGTKPDGGKPLIDEVSHQVTRHLGTAPAMCVTWRATKRCSRAWPAKSDRSAC